MTRRIVVVGGGISGLAAAHRLIEIRQERGADLEVLLLEAGERLGGCIATERVDGFLVESGPDSFITEKPWAVGLCERLGLASRVISTNAQMQKIYVVHQGTLKSLPEGFFLLAPTRFWPWVLSPLFSWRGKMRMGLDLFLPRGGAAGDESLASFVRRRFGSEVLERVAQPLIAGIYAADPEELSLAATMPRFFEMEKERRSIIRAMWLDQQRRSENRRRGSGARWSLFASLAGGMEEFVSAIASPLPDGTVQFGTEISMLELDAARKRWRIIAGRREKLEADGVILATPAHAAAGALAPLAPELAEELRAIHYVSTATVSLAFRREEVPHRLDGFGFVAPASEQRSLVACTFSSVKYSGRAPEGHVLLRAFVGGALQPSLFEQEDHEMEKSVRQELAALLGVKAAPLFCRVHRHPRSMPQYRVGHLERVRRIERFLTGLPRLALAGNAYHGVGIADCIHSGEQAAENLWHLLAGT